MLSICFPHPATHSIPLDGMPDTPADREPHPNPTVESGFNDEKATQRAPEKRLTLSDDTRKRSVAAKDFAFRQG